MTSTHPLVELFLSMDNCSLHEDEESCNADQGGSWPDTGTALYNSVAVLWFFCQLQVRTIRILNHNAVKIVVGGISVFYFDGNIWI